MVSHFLEVFVSLSFFDAMKSFIRLARLSARPLTVIAFLAALSLPARAATNEPFELKDGDRVLFIGDTFFEREVDYGHIETRLTAAFADRHISFRNLAWAADTPLGRSRASFDWNKPEQEWLKRVKEQVALVKPTVAFLSYGMTAALEQSSADDSAAERNAAMEKFKTDLGKLLDAIDEVSGRKVRFVLLGPARTSDVQKVRPPPSLKQSLEMVEDVLQRLAATFNQRFFSLNGFGGLLSRDM